MELILMKSIWNKEGSGVVAAYRKIPMGFTHGYLSSISPGFSF
jgi:hypothetical protein